MLTAPRRVRNPRSQRSPRKSSSERKSDRRMNEADEAIYQAITEAQRIRSVTRKKKLPQVRGLERDVIRATALAWFQSQRHKAATIFSTAELQPVDDMYQRIVQFSHKNAARARYVSTFKDIYDSLVQ